STEIRIFSYLQNSLLVVCFLGLGVGCWTCRQPARLRDTLLPLLALSAAMVPVAWLGIGSQLSLMLNAFGDILLFTRTVTESTGEAALRVVLGLVFTFVLMTLVWYAFVPLGRMLGRMLA